MSMGDLLTLVVLPLLLTEVGPWGGWLAKRLLRMAAFLRYGRTSRRSIRAEEWSRQLQEIPAPLSQLVYGFGHLLAGFAAVVLRIASRAWRGRRLDRDALLTALDASVVEDPNLAWQDRALCAQPETDPEAFFSKKGDSPFAAKRICARCDVRAECLQYALDNDERFGVWGGLTEKERRRLPGPAA